MLHVGVVVLGGYFCLTSLWWLVRTTACYYHSLQRHVDFRASITFPCCSSCNAMPVDGILKMVFAGAGAFVEFALDKGYEADRVFLSRMELGTVFMFLLFCGAMDVLAQWGARSFYRFIDYAGQVLFFAAMAVVLETRACSSEQPVSSIHSLSAYITFAGMVVTIMEAMHSDNVLFPVTRSFLFLLQGTWWLHVSFLLQQDILVTGIGVSKADVISFVSLLFALHVAVNFFFVLCLWLFVGKLVEKNCCSCCCIMFKGQNQNEGVFLENRVHLDYSVLSRFDSDSEKE